MTNTAENILTFSTANADDIARVFNLQQQTAVKLRRSTAEARIAKIEKLRDAVLENQDAIYAAMRSDFNKPEAEVDLGEIMIVKQDAHYAIKQLKQWMKPKKVKTTPALFGTSSYIKYEPRGVCLIVSPWNFPLMLLFGPLISALAAGNTAILKPSEMTPAVSELQRKIIQETFPEDEVAIFLGDAEVSKTLLDLPFDHCFFTGSPAVGKIVMGACAKHLTSVTLELGGKSPAFVHPSADLDKTAGSIIFGKCGNMGQSCTAPDYALVDPSVEADFVAALQKTIEQRYGDTLEKQKATPDLARIINQRHAKRLDRLIQDAIDKGATVAFGGDRDVDTCWIQPTVLTNVPDDAEIMHEEIFGPILAIRTWQSLDDAIALVNSKPKPLALYVYADDQSVIDKVLNETTSGDAGINACMMHFVNHHLPFGGVNNSGIGNAHGHHGFLTFSHERSVLRDKFAATANTMPPYTEKTRKFIRFVMKWLAR